MSAPTELLPGAIVYEPYAPAKYGKVLEVLVDPKNPHYPYYKVRWKDGREEIVWSLHINSLEQLVADHEKKLNTHRKNLVKARLL